MDLFIYVILSLYIEVEVKEVPQVYCNEYNTQVIYSTGTRGTLVEDVPFYVGDMGLCKYYPGTQKEIKGKQKTLNYIHGLAFHLWFTRLNDDEQLMFMGDEEDFANTMEYLYLKKFKTPVNDRLLRSRVIYIKDILQKKFGQE